MKITYTTDDPAKEYAAAIRKVETKDGLIKVLMHYKEFAPDAIKQAKSLTDDTFIEFQQYLKKAARKQSEKWTEAFIGRFGDIAMPEKMLIASLVADQFKVPWGTAFIRLTEEGWSILKDKKLS